ncbi:MAG: type II toxin-antitoxin system RelB/DinJ family antitoxin [Oscillospiraceae bacterium]|nr:type II toxin-antitoxin system RelB/DinJ family antitoxin [Oscillospiraceae bacterium]
MSQTSSVTIRMDSDDKRRAEQLFNSLGLNMTTAFNMFIKQSLLCEGLPFAVSLRSNADDYFYSKANTAHLDRSIAHLGEGRCSSHELIETADNE